MIVELGTFHHDVTHHAVVVGLVELRAGRPLDAPVAEARRLVGDGAAALELVGAAARWAEVVDVLGELGRPVGATVRDEVDLVLAARAGVAFVRIDSTAEPDGTALGLALGGALLGGAGAIGWSPSVIAPPAALDALVGRLSLPTPGVAPGRLGGSRRIVEVDLVDVGRGGVGGAHGADVGPPTALVGVTLTADLEADAAAATTIAVQRGARVIRTGAVRPARRAADLCATLLQERAGDPERGAA